MFSLLQYGSRGPLFQYVLGGSFVDFFSHTIESFPTSGNSPMHCRLHIEPYLNPFEQLYFIKVSVIIGGSHLNSEKKIWFMHKNYLYNILHMVYEIKQMYTISLFYLSSLNLKTKSSKTIE